MTTTTISRRRGAVTISFRGLSEVAGPVKISDASLTILVTDVAKKINVRQILRAFIGAKR